MDRKTILAVDDNPVNLASIEQALEEEYKVVLVAAPGRAFKYLDKYPVDLLLLDVQMPEMSGVEMLQELRGMKGGSNLPVIFLSAARDEYAAAEGEKLGVVDYIIKPFEAEELKRCIGRAISHEPSER